MLHIPNMHDDDLLATLLPKASRFLVGYFDTALMQANLGLTSGDARLLMTLEDVGAASQYQYKLAERLNVEPMSLVPTITKLEKLSLIDRLVESRDRRMKKVGLTPKGHAAVNAIRDVLLQASCTLTANLSVGERADLMRSLEKVTEIRPSLPTRGLRLRGRPTSVEGDG